MKPNFAKSSDESKTYPEMLGMSAEKWSEKQDQFVEAVKDDKITNSAKLAEWAIENSETTEEAVMLGIICSKHIEKMTRRNPLESLLRMMAERSEEENEEEEEENKSAERTA